MVWYNILYYYVVMMSSFNTDDALRFVVSNVSHIEAYVH